MAEVLRFPPKSPAESAFAEPPDAEARATALDIHRSFIVEAPAGSGKTGLLIQRFLKLLADPSVDQPEQVLAITFTTKATGELRDRVLAHLATAESAAPTTARSVSLNLAAASEPPGAPSIAVIGVPGERSLLAGVEERWVGGDNPAPTDFQSETLALAQAVVARDRQLGWQLLDHPHRIYIRTIDSVCAEIARTLPVLSDSGGRLVPTDDAEPLHREAARRTLLLLGNTDPPDPAFDDALRNLLLHRDGNLADCESLLADMLKLRDQWGDLVPLVNPQLDDAWLDANVLPRLELTLHHVISSALNRLAQLFPADALADLASLAHKFSGLEGYDGNPSPIALCACLQSPPEPLPSHLDHWLVLIHLLNTADGGWRKGFNVNHVGFKLDRNQKSQLKMLIDQLRHRDDLLDALCAVRALPSSRYPANQWFVAKSLFRVLSRALVELKLVFSARNQCDFTELSLLARQALRADSGPEDLAAALGARLQHLLVDEMQDTSTSQYELLELLTASWDGYSQTVFLVGDPRQSIYLFRQARVERFVRALHTKRLGELPLDLLRLTANFRSQSALVNQFNQDFALIFPPAAPPEDPPENLPEADLLALPYTPAQPTLPASSQARAAVWHINPVSADQKTGAPSLTAPSSRVGLTEPLTPAQLRRQQARRDALEIRRIARDWFAKPLPPDRRTIRDESGDQIAEPWRIAVLVRARTHLDEIVAALKFAAAPDESAIPFRAIDIDSLNQRQEVLDLTALTRALLHPADRIAALAVLRAPWCGLSLADLHTLTGADDPAIKDHSIQRLMNERGHLLPEDSRQRLTRVSNLLQYAAAQRGRLTPSQLVERAWLSLGGDVWLKPDEIINTNNFFNLLDELHTQLEENSSTGLLDPTLLDSRLHKLFAEPAAILHGQPFVELLTIHKAKGLEWDVVIVPALHLSTGHSRSRLLTWEEIDSHRTPDSAGEDAAHLMLAPIAAKGEEVDDLTRWLNRIHRTREAAERKRLFYVACTRARQELHLFAAPDLKISGEPSVSNDSLLNAAWPAAEPHFASTSSGAPGLDSETWDRGMDRRGSESPAEPFVLDLAAAALPSHHTLQRLPLAFDPAARLVGARARKLPYGAAGSSSDPSQSPFSRPEGAFAARSFGNVVHAALEILAGRIASGHSPAALLAKISSWTPRLTAMLRADGLPHATVNRLARDARQALESTLRDPNGLWLLASHPGAATEFALTAWPESKSHAESDSTPASASASIRPASIRMDRIFRAGPEPNAPGNDFLWIVDYKTAAHSLSNLDGFLAAQRAVYAPQLETYARILNQFPYPADLPAPKDLRLALYYPNLPHLHWWPLT